MIVIGENNVGIWLKAGQYVGAKLGFNPCPSGLFSVISQGLKGSGQDNLPFWNLIDRDLNPLDYRKYDE
jgi:hypothetical protein